MAERIAVCRMSTRGWQAARTALGRAAKEHESALTTLRANARGRTRATTNAIERRERELADYEAALAEIGRGWDVGHDAIFEAAERVSDAWTAYVDDDVVDGMAFAIGNLRGTIARYKTGAST